MYSKLMHKKKYINIDNDILINNSAEINNYMK
jgi:hypothetical protein